MTVLELLKTKMSHEYIVAIIANMEDKTLLDEVSELPLADELEGLFDWDESNEGFSFWDEVYNAIMEGNQLPKIAFRATWYPNTYICTTTDSILLNANGSGKDLKVIVDMSERPSTLAEKYFMEQHLAFCN